MLLEFDLSGKNTVLFEYLRDDDFLKFEFWLLVDEADIVDVEDDDELVRP